MKLRNETRGGARKGAGRKRLDISEKEVRAILKSTRDWSKKSGKPFWDRLIAIAQSEESPAAIAAFKVITSVLVAKQSHETKEVYNYSPAILPVLEDDPSKIDLSKAAQSPVH